METAVEVENVKFTYPDGSVALRNVSLKIMKGERVAILGPNGAGKSTLLMLIHGLLTPTKGSIKVFGTPVKEENFPEIRRRVGMAFQNPDDQLFCPTLWEDVTFGPSNMGLPEEEVVRRGKEALDTVGLAGLEEKPPHRLSVGERKKAAIATVLSMKPEILILDEPTANLDPRSRIELVNHIRGICEKHGTTLIVATHDVNFVPFVAEKAFILSDGQVLLEGLLKEVFLNLDLIKKAGLEIPIITRFCSLLYQSMSTSSDFLPPLTINEALEQVKTWLNKSKRPPFR